MKKKKKKGFKRSEVLIIDYHEMNKVFQDLFHKYYSNEYESGYNRYYSEFDPCGKEDYSHTFTQKSLEQYWKDMVKENGFDGNLEKFVDEYGLAMDVWFINCGYDFTGIKEIIIDY
jgi:hypothetical protein